jgi:hypothetical protein
LFTYQEGHIAIHLKNSRHGLVRQPALHTSLLRAAAWGKKPTIVKTVVLLAHSNPLRHQESNCRKEQVFISYCKELRRFSNSRRELYAEISASDV